MHAGGIVRTLHVAAALLVVLGAAAAAARPALARRYEWLFWGAALALVITGIGNLGALGGAAGGEWGARFRWKLGLVVALLLGSGARLLLVALDAPARALRNALLATALAGGSALALGLVLAHA